MEYFFDELMSFVAVVVCIFCTIIVLNEKEKNVRERKKNRKNKVTIYNDSTRINKRKMKIELIITMYKNDSTKNRTF